jgi:flagellar basal-body rod protein FlgB
MSFTQTDIFDAAEKRLAWTSERETVLARNIANLSTPGFQEADEIPFRKVLDGEAGIELARTDPDHLPGTIDPGFNDVSRQTTLRTVDKNGVDLEEQLMKVADTETLHATVTAIYKKYMDMFDTALGKGSS